MIRKARKGFKFVGSATGSSDEGVGEIIEGFEVSKNEECLMFVNRSEDEDKPDWVEVYLVYEVPISATFTPIDEEDIDYHPDWRD